MPRIGGRAPRGRRHCDVRCGRAAGSAAGTRPLRQPEVHSSGTAGRRNGTATVGGTPKLTGKAFHEASKRVSQIERKLAKLEEEKSELETRMAEHDPSDYAGLNEMNVRLQTIAEETEPLELEWMELSEQLE